MFQLNSFASRTTGKKWQGLFLFARWRTFDTFVTKSRRAKTINLYGNSMTANKHFYWTGMKECPCMEHYVQVIAIITITSLDNQEDALFSKSGKTVGTHRRNELHLQYRVISDITYECWWRCFVARARLLQHRSSLTVR